MSPAGSRRILVVRLVLGAVLLNTCVRPTVAETNSTAIVQPGASEKQITRGPGNRILTNIGVWSPDGRWIVYDVRSGPAGEVFDGRRIELVNVETGEVRVVYTSQNGACCGAASFNPREAKVAFILGPEFPTPDWQYNFCHRQGVVVELDKPGIAQNLDARDIVQPFTPGALRGGSHVHVWDPQGQWVSFTYEDHVLSQATDPAAEPNLRNVGVSVPGHPVVVKSGHQRNHNGTHFSVVVTRTTGNPKAGSDEIKKAFEEGWVGTHGYMRLDGRRQAHALAFQGMVVGASGDPVAEVFVVDLPEDLTLPGNRPLEGTALRMPAPPKGCAQRRLTNSTQRKFPGIQGPRHWLRASPDGSQIAFLMKDDVGIVQLWTVSPNGGPIRQLTRNPFPVSSSFTWSGDGRFIAHAMDRSVCVTEAVSGKTVRLTSPVDEPYAPRPEACVFSPDAKRIAFVRRVGEPGAECNQIFVAEVPPL